MDRTEQMYVMKFLFMDGRKYKAIHIERSRVLKGHAASLDLCKRWYRKFKADREMITITTIFQSSTTNGIGQGLHGQP
jgi:hypothetical protein